MVQSARAQALATAAGFDPELLDVLVGTHQLLLADAPVLRNPMLRQLLAKPIPVSVHAFKSSVVVGVILPRHFWSDKEASLLVSFDSLKAQLSEPAIAKLDKQSAGGDSSRRIHPLAWSGEKGKKDLRQGSRVLAMALEKRQVIPSRMLAEVVTFVQFDLSKAKDLLPPNADLLMPYIAIVRRSKLSAGPKKDLQVRSTLSKAYMRQGRHVIREGSEAELLLDIDGSAFPEIQVKDNNSSLIASALLPINESRTQVQIQQIELSRATAAGSNTAAWSILTNLPTSAGPLSVTALQGSPVVGEIYAAFKATFTQVFGQVYPGTAGSFIETVTSGALAWKNAYGSVFLDSSSNRDEWPQSLDSFITLQNYKVPTALPPVEIDSVTSQLLKVDANGITSSVLWDGNSYKITMRWVEFKVQKPVEGAQLAAKPVKIAFAGGRLSDVAVLEQVWEKALRAGFRELVGPAETEQRLEQLLQAHAEKPLFRILDEYVPYGGGSKPNGRANLVIEWEALADELNRIGADAAAADVVFPSRPVFIRPTFEPIVPYPWLLAHPNGLVEGSLAPEGSGIFAEAGSSPKGEPGVAFPNMQPGCSLVGSLNGNSSVLLTSHLSLAGNLKPVLEQGSIQIGQKLVLNQEMGTVVPNSFTEGGPLRTTALPAIAWKDSYLWNTVEQTDSSRKVLSGNDAWVAQASELDAAGADYISGWAKDLAATKASDGSDVFGKLSTAAAIEQHIRRHVQLFTPSLICQSDGSEWSLKLGGIWLGAMAKHQHQLDKFTFAKRNLVDKNGKKLFDPADEIKVSGRLRMLSQMAHQTYIHNAVSDLGWFPIEGSTKQEASDHNIRTRRAQAALPMRYWLRGPLSTIGSQGLLCGSVLFEGIRGSDAFANQAASIVDHEEIPAKILPLELAASAPSSLPVPITSIPDITGAVYQANNGKLWKRTMQRPFMQGVVLPFLSQNGKLELITTVAKGAKAFDGQLLFDAAQAKNYAELEQMRAKIPYPSTFHFTQMEQAGFGAVGSFIAPPEFVPGESAKGLEGLLASRSKVISAVGSDLFGSFNAAIGVSNQPVNKRFPDVALSESISTDPNLYAVFAAAKMLAELIMQAAAGESSFHIDTGKEGGPFRLLRDVAAKDKHATALAQGYNLDGSVLVDDAKSSSGSRLIGVIPSIRQAKGGVRFSLRNIPGSASVGSQFFQKSGGKPNLAQELAYSAAGAVTKATKSGPVIKHGAFATMAFSYDSSKLEIGHVHSGMIATIADSERILQVSSAPRWWIDSRMNNESPGFFNLSDGSGATISANNAEGTMLLLPQLGEGKLLESTVVQEQGIAKQKFSFPAQITGPSVSNLPSGDQWLNRPGQEETAELLDGWIPTKQGLVYSGGAALAIEILARWQAEGSPFSETKASVNRVPSYGPHGIGDRLLEEAQEAALAAFPVPLPVYNAELIALNLWVDRLRQGVQAYQSKAAPPSSFFLADPTANVARGLYKSRGAESIGEASACDFMLKVPAAQGAPILARLGIPRIAARSNFFADPIGFLGAHELGFDLAGGIYGLPISWFSIPKAVQAYGASFMGTHIEIRDQAGALLLKQVLSASGQEASELKIPLGSLTTLAGASALVRSRPLLGIVVQLGEIALVIPGAWSEQLVELGDLKNASELVVEMIQLDQGKLLIPRLTRLASEEQIETFQWRETEGGSFIVGNKASGKISSVDPAKNLSSIELKNGSMIGEQPSEGLFAIDVPLQGVEQLGLKVELPAELQRQLLGGKASVSLLDLIVDVDGALSRHVASIAVEPGPAAGSAALPLPAQLLKNLGGAAGERLPLKGELRAKAEQAVMKAEAVFGRQDQVTQQQLQSNLDIVRGELPLSSVTIQLALIKGT